MRRNSFPLAIAVHVRIQKGVGCRWFRAPCEDLEQQAGRQCGRARGRAEAGGGGGGGRRAHVTRQFKKKGNDRRSLRETQYTLIKARMRQ